MKVLALSEGAVTGGVRVWLRGEGLIVLILSVLTYRQLGPRWWIFAGLVLAPDLSMLGYLINAKVGGMTYNLVHSYVLPLGLAAIAIVAHRGDLVSLLCIWTAHIGLDRALGYGLKYPSAFGRTHLGMLGKTSS